MKLEINTCLLLLIYLLTPVLHGLYWLPINQPIVFQIMTITFKSHHDLAPKYLIELVTPYRPKRSLTSAKKDL